jgi:hypothetical protein
VEIFLLLCLASLLEELPLSKAQRLRLAALLVRHRVGQELVMQHTMPRRPLAFFLAAVLLFFALLLQPVLSPAERLRQLLPLDYCVEVGRRMFQMYQEPVSPEDLYDRAKPLPFHNFCGYAVALQVLRCDNNESLT